MYHALKWINMAVGCQVQELDLEIGVIQCQVKDDMYDIPHSVFNSKVLRVLKLNLNDQNLKKPLGVFVSLEELSLQMLHVSENILKEWISTACPALKRLTLAKLHGNNNIIIFNQCLEKLTVVDMSFSLCSIHIVGNRLQSLSMDLNTLFPRFTCKLTINAPGLVDLRWTATSPNNIYLSEFKYLCNAAICVGVENYYLGEVTICNRLAGLLHGIRHATVLQINIDVLGMMFTENLLPDEFGNLCCLAINVGSLMDCHFPVIAYMLMKSLNGEALSIKCSASSDKPDYVKKMRVMASKIRKQYKGFHNLIGHQLKEIDIELQGRGHRIGLVKNMMKVAKGLKKITIFYSREYFNMLSKIGLQNSEPSFLPFEVNLVEKEFRVDHALYSFSL